MNLGISTIYFSNDITRKKITWQEIQKEIYKLIDQGITCIELNADIPIDWIEEIQNWTKKSNIRISSLHNFCPAVENIPEGKYGFNVYSLTSLDETERNLALKYTLRTIDYAQKLQAEVVILHLGEITTDPSGIDVYKIATQFGINSTTYLKYKEALVESRQKNKPYYMSILYSVLDKIVKYAELKQVKLGIESRFFPHEIPNFEEIGEIIQRYNSRFVGYWHDFGHVEIQTRLGFLEGHKKFFEVYGQNLLGYHIHGVKGLIDHFSPINSEINFEEFLNFQNEKLYILEVHAKENFKNVEKGVHLIKKILTNGRQE